MSLVDRTGVQMKLDHSLDPRDPEKAKDLAVIGYRSQGWTFREIARVLSVSHQAVHKRWQNIPPEARAFYARSRSLG